MGKDKLDMPPYYQVNKQVPAHDALKLVDAGKIAPVGDLQGFNQFGDAVSLSRDLPGKMLAIDFIFTSCRDVCPKLTKHMQIMEHAFRRTPMKRNDTTVQFISISVDPANDSVDVLRAYAKERGIDEDHWWFITGNKKAIYDWARNQLHLAVPAGDGGAEDFMHTSQIVVLDRDRFVRGYYDGLDTSDIMRCAYDLGLLVMEKKKGKYRE